MPEPDHYAVFGHPIKHSKSPEIHQLFARQTRQHLVYTAEDVPADSFTDAVNVFFSSGGKGLNCTVPLKELAWALADQKTKRAELSMAANTLALQNDGSILGDNTDGIGLITDLTKNHEIVITGTNVLVLGAGGATRGIIGPLLEESPSRLVIANRTIEKAINIAEQFASYGSISGSGYADIAGQKFDLIINATSASLIGQLPPLANDLLKTGGNCYDLAYSSEATAFVRWGQQQKAVKCLDGAGMLVEQAAEAYYIWRNVRPDTKPVIDWLVAKRNW